MKPHLRALVLLATLVLVGFGAIFLRVSPGKEQSVAQHALSEIQDVALEGLVKVRLLSEIGFNALRIDVDARGSVVSLRGLVRSRDVERLAVEEARKVRGVTKVISLLRAA